MRLLPSIFIVFLLSFALLACNESSYSPTTVELDPLQGRDTMSVLLGTWESEIYITPDQAREIYGEDVEGMDVAVSSFGTLELHRGGRYNYQEESTLEMSFGAEKIALAMLLKEVGEWKVQDGHLIMILEDSKIDALDDDTRRILRSAPEFKAMFEPISGETESLKLIKLSPERMQFSYQDMPALVITANKVEY